MGQYDEQHQVSSTPRSVTYDPAPPTSYPPPSADKYNGPYVMAPPPMGYPTRDAPHHDPAPTATTTTRGDGFLKGCLAGLCCCCCLDCCF